MKKLIILAVLATAFHFSAFSQTPYRTAIGLAIDLGKGSSMFGPQIKHVFGKNAAAQAQVMFSNGDFMYIGADYQYLQNFPESNAIAWYLGIGPQIGINSSANYSDFTLRPQAGLEVKLPEVPLAMSLDWKPWWRLTHSSYFEPGNFTLGIKYIVK